MQVLIIEDDEGVAELMRRIVEKCGYEVVNVFCAAEALQWLRTSVPQLILLDYSLPDSNALEFLQSLRNQGSVLPPVILTTGFDSTGIPSDLQSLGIVAYLRKDQDFLAGLSRAVCAQLH